jgi:hypothetical protein
MRASAPRNIQQSLARSLRRPNGRHRIGYTLWRPNGRHRIRYTPWNGASEAGSGVELNPVRSSLRHSLRVGAVYDSERGSKNYAHVRPPQMCDGIVFISESTAAKPLN